MIKIILELEHDLNLNRGGTLTWKPNVTPIGDIPRPGSVNSSSTFTRTSLARNTPVCDHIFFPHQNVGNNFEHSNLQESRPIGTGHNVKPKPFANVGNRMLVHNQYNSPVGLYSMDNIKEALDAHTEQLAPGVMG